MNYLDIDLDVLHESEEAAQRHQQPENPHKEYKEPEPCELSREELLDIMEEVIVETFSEELAA